MSNHYDPLSGMNRVKISPRHPAHPARSDLMQTRRTLVAALGLAPTGALAAETFVPVPAEKGGITTGSGVPNERISGALRALATLIDQKSVIPCELDCICKISADAVLQHALTVTFVYSPGDTPDA